MWIRVSKKVSKKATVRNKVKRRIREAIRGLDLDKRLIISAKPEIVNATLEDIKKDLQNVIRENRR